MSVESEGWFRISAFVIVLLGMMLWERLAPRRTLSLNRRLRWPSNLAIVALNTALVRVIIPISAVGLAALAQTKGWGIFNALGIGGARAFLISFLSLDLVIYFQHRWFHQADWLWPLHRMHHADQDIDVTTGARFHPLEILISMLIKMATVLVLGAPAAAVFAFEVVLNATSMFNHGNVWIPPRVDRWLRFLIVTPDMHRIHHSVEHEEMNRNFGFNLALWDRLFGTYRSQPSLSQESMRIGLIEYRKAQDQRLDQMILHPFINRNQR